MIGPARLVVLASGGGRTLENLQTEIAAGRLDARIALVIVSRGDAGARARAERLGLHCLVIGKSTHPDKEKRENTLLASILEARPDWVVMAGWLQMLPIPPELEGLVINIHPALLPAYGGRGYYGHHVHEAVAKDKALLSGCTVHFADAEYDRGPIVLQEAVPLEPGMSPDAIAAAVFEAEKRALPEALRSLISGRASLEGDRVVWT